MDHEPTRRERSFLLALVRRAVLLQLVFAALGLWTAAASGDETVSLAGNWQFRLDPHDQGIAEAWPNGTLPDRIQLPGTTDEAGFGEKSTGAEVGVLTRLAKYYGAAWYQREITVPESWREQDVEVFLERVIWESRVWVDGQPGDTQQSLNTPHVHRLGRLTPGRHTLTLRIDNRPLCPIGVNGHSYTEQTQTIWNGAVGRIELRAHPSVCLGLTRVFPDAAAQQIQAEITLQNGTGVAQSVTLHLAVREHDSRAVVARSELPCTALPGTTVLKPLLALDDPPVLWDEFTPQFYELVVTALTQDAQDSRCEVFGFRQVSRIGQHIGVNGRPVFLRGNLDCVHFPLTGYPAMDVDGWKRIFRIYQAHGLNHVRFHTWTPPEAAFVAADELGIYIQCEVLWVQRPLGRDKPGVMERMDSTFPDALLNPPGTVDAFVHDEMRRVIDTYGNHPSFLLFTIGNELGSFDPEVCGDWIQELKDHDPRRFYAVSTARRIVPQDDFNATHAIPGVGSCRDRLEPFNDWDYEPLYAAAPVPILAHEVGQWPAFPVWNEMEKYTGVLRARNFERFQRLAEANHVADLDHEFRAASGAISLRLYKDEIESHLRTPSCSGFQLLSMQDFSGQGEALVGWLDSFYDSKGIVTPERFRRWCGPTVPLARLPKYTFDAGETLTGRVEIAHYGPTPLRSVKAVWYLRDAQGTMMDQGEWGPIDVPVSCVTSLGAVSARLDRCKTPCRARLEVRLDGTDIANDWDIWVFPPNAADAAAGIKVCDSLETALEILRGGGSVLLDAHTLGTKENADFARFKPAYWSAWMFKGQYTLGALVRADHPALAAFPSERHFDWQWEELCRSGRAFRLAGLPADYQPIVQPICDFHFNWKLGSVFELRTSNGGKLLVCGYDITNQLQRRPAARQLRASLLAYMASSRFTPDTAVDETLLRTIIPAVQAKLLDQRSVLAWRTGDALNRIVLPLTNARQVARQ